MLYLLLISTKSKFLLNQYRVHARKDSSVQKSFKSLHLLASVLMRIANLTEYNDEALPFLDNFLVRTFFPTRPVMGCFVT